LKAKENRLGARICAEGRIITLGGGHHIPDTPDMTFEDAEARIRKELKKVGIRGVTVRQGWIDNPNHKTVVAMQDPQAGTIVHRTRG